MEKLALNATLGRLWRTWRKRRRNTTLARTLSRESFRRRGYTQNLTNSRKNSIVTVDEPQSPQEPLPEDLPAPVDPAAIPLPIGDYDVQEIEVPGFSAELEDEVQTMEAVVAHKVRPRSLMVFTSSSLTPKSPGKNGSPLSAGAIDNAKSLRHARSRSLPNAAASPPRVPRQTFQEAEPAVAADQPSPQLSEEKKHLETMYEDDESMEFVDAVEIAPGTAITGVPTSWPWRPGSSPSWTKRSNVPMVARSRRPRCASTWRTAARKRCESTSPSATPIARCRPPTSMPRRRTASRHRCGLAPSWLCGRSGNRPRPHRHGIFYP